MPMTKRQLNLTYGQIFNACWDNILYQFLFTPLGNYEQNEVFKVLETKQYNDFDGKKIVKVLRKVSKLACEGGITYCQMGFGMEAGSPVIYIQLPTYHKAQTAILALLEGMKSDEFNIEDGRGSSKVRCWWD